MKQCARCKMRSQRLLMRFWIHTVVKWNVPHLSQSVCHPVRCACRWWPRTARPRVLWGPIYSQTRPSRQPEGKKWMWRTERRNADTGYRIYRDASWLWERNRRKRMSLPNKGCCAACYRWDQVTTSLCCCAIFIWHHIQCALYRFLFW